MLCEVFVFVIKCNPTHLVQNKNEWSWQERRNITQANFLNTSWLITLSSMSCLLIFCSESSLFESWSIIHLSFIGYPLNFKTKRVSEYSLLWINTIWSSLSQSCHIKFTSIVSYDIMRAAPCDTVLLHSYPRPNWHWLLRSESECPLLCLCVAEAAGVYGVLWPLPSTHSLMISTHKCRYSAINNVWDVRTNVMEKQRHKDLWYDLINSCG